MWKPVILLLIAAPFLGACERYTEQTSPCFGRNGEPVVSRAAFSLTAPVAQPAAPGSAVVTNNAVEATENAAAKDCSFEELARPV